MAANRKLTNPRKFQLSSFDTRDTDGVTKEEAALRLAKLGPEMGELMEMLFAAGEHALLIILQGMDTSGKDGTIRKILSCVNVQSCRVVPFKVPTLPELKHDFLWRIHHQTPAKGEVVIFNRSHYEDVVVVRVKDLVPKKVWQARYEQINTFEKLMADTNTIILKFFLHISKKEQEERLLDREKDVSKAWKLNVGDWQDRERWSDFLRAYNDALGQCAAPHAPWFIVPADRKWYRDLFIAEAIVQALRPYKSSWKKRLQMIGREAKKGLADYRRAKGGKQE